jgi:hypothetical protein
VKHLSVRSGNTQGRRNAVAMPSIDKGLGVFGAFLLLTAILRGAVKSAVMVEYLNPIQASAVALLGTVCLWLAVRPTMSSSMQAIVILFGFFCTGLAFVYDGQVDRVSASDISVTASSWLETEGEVTYVAENTTDGDARTAWNDGVGGDGVGESLTYTFGSSVNLHAISVLNGYDKDDLWIKNSRIGTLRIRTDQHPDGFIVELEDTRDFQSIKRNFGRTRRVVLTVEEVVSGDGPFAPDVALSEIEFYGTAADGRPRLNLRSP